MLYATSLLPENALAMACYDAFTGASAMVCVMQCTNKSNPNVWAMACHILLQVLVGSRGGLLEVVDIGHHHLHPVRVLELEHVLPVVLPPVTELVASHMLASFSLA